MTIKVNATKNRRSLFFFYLLFIQFLCNQFYDTIWIECFDSKCILIVCFYKKWVGFVVCLFCCGFYVDFIWMRCMIINSNWVSPSLKLERQKDEGFRNTVILFLNLGRDILHLKSDLKYYWIINFIWSVFLECTCIKALASTHCSKSY